MQMQDIDGLINKYVRRLLTKVENNGILDAVLRKHILDEMNNLRRELSAHINQNKDRSM